MGEVSLSLLSSGANGSHPVTAACQTSTVPVSNADVADDKRMAAFAVRLGSLFGRLRFDGFADKFRRIASSDILSVRNRLEMLRVYTMPHTAKMIKLKAIWDCTDKQFVCNDMGTDSSLGIVPATTYAHISIAITATSSGPDPTSRTQIGCYLGQKSTHDGLVAGFNRLLLNRPTSLDPSLIVSMAKSTSEMWPRTTKNGTNEVLSHDASPVEALMGAYRNRSGCGFRVANPICRQTIIP